MGLPHRRPGLACSLSGATRLACAGRPSGQGREGDTGDAEGPPESGARERGHLARRPHAEDHAVPCLLQLFPGDVLALLETSMPLLPLEWPPS